MISRRTALVGLASSGAIAATAADTTAKSKRKFTIDLRPTSIGVKATQRETIALAAKHGFESVGANAREIGSMNDSEIQTLVEQLQAANWFGDPPGCRWSFARRSRGSGKI